MSTLLKKAHDFLESKGINHSLSNAIVIFLCCAMVLASFWAGVAKAGGLFTVGAQIAIGVGAFMAIFFTTIYFLGGVAEDVIKKVFSDPIATAIFTGLFANALAQVIRG